MSLQLPASWSSHLASELQQDYAVDLSLFLDAERAAGKTIYPAQEDTFAAFAATAFADVKVVILGQDPYHGAGQAHGLSFSVLPGQKIPPSLRNIYKELQSDLNLETADHGCLDAWARAGVLLLNATMTVEQKKPGSHQGRGWEQFTDAVIRCLSEKREHIVFMLWGNFAQSKAELIDADRHLILKAAHPSPFSAHRGFLGCRHFSSANAYLTEHGKSPVDWSLNSEQPQLSFNLE
ncbi:uracil-DNA glycosylase [Mariprofundus sp. KV]|uniref:uracil-DNA glycosylase n=1 Tax=Mariprofundus sp. KV TaxID=2608715 RepID=UPI0015A3AD2C|nr:uracil-DNA glycosylase [Mariprofundus sp. KV]NWF35348.1 uracil-DNA glycosylase [Mariprofundus sp. KV]